MRETQGAAAAGRRENPALVTGSATYTDDVQPTDLLHAAVRRCPYGHVRVKRVDVEPVIELDGVLTLESDADEERSRPDTGQQLVDAVTNE